jgi:hypothetical protein
MVELYKENCFIRELVTKQVTKTDTSDKKFSFCSWIDKEHYVTSAADEV